RLGVQRCVQRKRAVSEVFKPVPLSSSGRHRQYRVKPIQSLNATLFINTKNSSMLRWIYIQADDVSCLLLKLWIIRRHIALKPMRLKSSSLPYPSHHHMVNTEVFGQLAGAPMGGSIRRHPTSPLQNLRLQPRSAFLNRPTRMTRVQTGNSLFKESLLPQRDESRSALQLF